MDAEKKPVIPCQNEVCVFLVRSEEGRGKVICTSHCRSAETEAFLRSETALVFTCGGRLTAIESMTPSYSTPGTWRTPMHSRGGKTSLHLLQARRFYHTQSQIFTARWTHTLTTRYPAQWKSFPATVPQTDCLPATHLKSQNSYGPIHYLQQFRKKYNHFILTITVSILTVQPNVGWQQFFRFKIRFWSIYRTKFCFFFFFLLL